MSNSGWGFCARFSTMLKVLPGEFSILRTTGAVSPGFTSTDSTVWRREYLLPLISRNVLMLVTENGKGFVLVTWRSSRNESENGSPWEPAYARAGSLGIGMI